MNELTKLIYGKAGLQHIVGLEIESDYAVAFTEKDGVVNRLEVPHKYWMLSNEKLGVDWFKLEGNQYYQYGKQYDKHWKMRVDKEKYLAAGNDLFLITNPSEALMTKDGFCYYQGLQPNEVSILCFDIETTGFAHDETSKVLLIANTFRSNGKIQRKMFCYDDYENGGEMIDAWCKWVQEVNPAILCGHNIYGFDFPYLQYIASTFDKDLNLGRDGSRMKTSKYEAKFRVDGSRDIHYHKVNIYGREVCDTMFLAYKYDFSRNYESYGLKYIINYENLEKEDRVFYDANNIRKNYKISEEWEKIKAYAEDDGDDALALYDLMVAPIFYFTQSIPKPFQLMVESATGAQLNSLMVRSYLQDKHSIAKATEIQNFQGAYSLGIPGIYRNVFKIDVKSEYPSCILQYKIYDEVKDPRANFYKMVQFFTDQRLNDKELYKKTGDRKYYDMEQSRKIGINSAYGLLNTPGLGYNSPSNAAKVTEMGRKTINDSTVWATGKNVEHWLDLLEQRFPKKVKKEKKNDG